MKIVYVGEEPPRAYAKSVLLVGPTLQEPTLSIWRRQVVRLFEEAGYDGVVFVPEPRGGTAYPGNSKRLAWEKRCARRADCILFWVPPTRPSVPLGAATFTWGVWRESGKMVLGIPPRARHAEHLRDDAAQVGVPVAGTLEGVVRLALKVVGAGHMRRDGEGDVPLLVWRTSAFQAWYRAQVEAGNTLERARLLWTFRVGPERDVVLFWALRVSIWVEREQRHKDNEIVIGRPDISSVLLYRRATTIEETIIVLVREFRSPARTEDGYIRELPGGSSFKPVSNPESLAANECREATGLDIDPARFRVEGTRQVAGTTTSHAAALFSAELTDDELARLRAQRDKPHGVAGDTERTYVELTTVGEILSAPVTDWATLGMVMQVLAETEGRSGEPR